MSLLKKLINQWPGQSSLKEVWNQGRFYIWFISDPNVCRKFSQVSGEEVSSNKEIINANWLKMKVQFLSNFALKLKCV